MNESAAQTHGGQGRNLHADIVSLQRQAGNQVLGPLVHSERLAQERVPQIIDSLLSNGTGHPIDAPMRSLMGLAFNEDFDSVRLHTDEMAHKSAQALDAAAYTIGEHIVFGPSWYAPTTSVGRHVLAHELAHVVQQRNAGGIPITSLNQPGDEFERSAEIATSLIAYNEPAAISDTVSDLLVSSSAGRPAAVQRLAVAAPKLPSSSVTPLPRHRKPIPDEVKAEMIRQILVIRDLWAGRFHAVKGSEVQTVVNLVWEYVNRGRDAASGGVWAPSDWVDTFIGLMSQTVYDRGAVFADHVNLLDDALENASPSQRAEIKKYLSQVDSEYINYQTPDRSRDPSFLSDVVAPVAWKGLELLSLGIFDKTLLEALHVAATERNMPVARKALETAGILLARRVSAVLTFGGGPAAYDNVLAYRKEHPNDPLAMSIAAAGEGFARGLVNTILPVEEIDILTAENGRNVTVWQKMEAFFSALLKVVTLGEMAKGKGAPKETGLAEHVEPPEVGASPEKTGPAIVGEGGIVTVEPEGSMKSQATPETEQSASIKTPSEGGREQAPIRTKPPVTEAVSKSTAKPPSAGKQTASRLRSLAAAAAIATKRTAIKVMPGGFGGSRPAMETARPGHIEFAEPRKTPLEETGVELQRGTPQTQAVPHAEFEPQIDLTKESGLELERGTPQTEAVPYAEFEPQIDLTKESGLELERGTPQTEAVPHRELEPQIDVTKKSGMAKATSAKARAKAFRMRTAKPEFGEPSTELGGTEHRKGEFFHERNVAEVGPGVLNIKFDRRAGRPSKVSFRLSEDMFQGSQQSEREFKPDISVEAAQPTAESFTNSGFDRGHLAPREAFKGSVEEERAVDQTTNVVPMKPELNQRLWREAEVRSRALASEYGAVNVEIEPVYDPIPERLGDGTPIPKAIKRKITTLDGRVLEDASYFNR